MKTILVWMLLSTSDGVYNRGTVTVVGHFPDAEQCEHVRKNIPNTDSLNSRCVQAKLVVEGRTN
jgi:hypothetical protein